MEIPLPASILRESIVAELEETDTVFGSAVESTTQAEDDSANAAKQGTLMGVFLPCTQNILGIIVFLRLPWICSESGILLACLQVAMCVGLTTCTALSMAAISTNGKIRAGGSYAMISSCLGPSFGGAIGLLFYLGTTVGSALYVLGAVEAFLVTVTPEECLKDVIVNGTALACDNPFELVEGFNMQIWGIVLALILFGCVSVGIKYVSAIGIAFLVPVFVGILAAWVGIFMLGTSASQYTEPGAGIGKHFADNLLPKYATSSFGTTLAILFPGLTGFEAGSNRSGVLANAAFSIPRGTFSAIAFTGFVYLSVIILFGASLDRDTLANLDAFIFAKIAWPLPVIVKVAVILSSVGAGLQTMAGAPQVLATMATDFCTDIPWLSVLKAPYTEPGKPIKDPANALRFTFLLVICVVLSGDINVVAPIITQFFVLSYVFINVACVLMVVLKSPSWRPTFRFFSKYSGGAAICLGLFIMFVDQWYMGAICIGIFLGVYYYISSINIERDWGDGVKGMKFNMAIENILDLNYYFEHARSYRPSFLMIQQMNYVSESLEEGPIEFKDNAIDEALVHLSHVLTMGKGGAQMIGVIEANNDDRKNPWETNSTTNVLAQSGTALIRQKIKENNMRAIGRAICWHNASEAASMAIQSTGLGVLTPNTVVLRYPKEWKNDKEPKSFFLSCLSSSFAFKKAIVVGCGLEYFPKEKETLAGTIDIWWQNDKQTGSMMLLYAAVLKQCKAWKKCKIRLFALSYVNDMPQQMKSDIEKYLLGIRIQAEVEVVEVHEQLKQGNDVTIAEALEKTLKLEERMKIMALLKEAKKAEKATPSFSQPYGKAGAGQDEKQGLLSADVVAGSNDGGGDTDVKVDIADSAAIEMKEVKADVSEELARDLTDPTGAGAVAGENAVMGLFAPPDDTEEAPPPPPPVPPALPSDAASNASGQRARTESVEELGAVAAGLTAIVQESKEPTAQEMEQKRMRQAMRYNKMFREKSQGSSLVMVSLPDPALYRSPSHFLSFVDTLTEGLPRVLLVRGSGAEVVTNVL